jgi:hypothetical protein
MMVHFAQAFRGHSISIVYVDILSVNDILHPIQTGAPVDAVSSRCARPKSEQE